MQSSSSKTLSRTTKSFIRLHTQRTDKHIPPPSCKLNYAKTGKIKKNLKCKKLNFAKPKWKDLCVPMKSFWFMTFEGSFLVFACKNCCNHTQERSWIHTKPPQFEMVLLLCEFEQVALQGFSFTLILIPSVAVYFDLINKSTVEERQENRRRVGFDMCFLIFCWEGNCFLDVEWRFVD